MGERRRGRKGERIVGGGECERVKSVEIRTLE